MNKVETVLTVEALIGVLDRLPRYMGGYNGSGYVFVSLDDFRQELKSLTDPRYTLTDLGEAYRRAMAGGAKLNGAVKAGDPE